MRAAIYFAPPAEHPLTRAAAAWLGRDAFTGAAMRRGDVPGFEPAEIDALTADPRRYGFHATLKPPFRFADGQGIDSLRPELAAFAETRAAVPMPALRLERLGPFFALTPADPVPALHALGADIVRGFDAFRAPPSEDEIARRRPERLSTRQREHLDAWGYPYVLDEFRFHMTLTGPVPEERRSAMGAVLAERFAAFVGRPLLVDAVGLFVEPSPPGDFVIDTVAPLGAPAA
jgi:putative phosphonate metabolism protein